MASTKRLHTGEPVNANPSGLQRIVRFHPAFERGGDFRGVDLRFILVGPCGAVHFLLYTNWHIHDLQKKPRIRFPIPADVGVHQPVGLQECEWLGVCNYERAPGADYCFERLVKEGDAGVWDFLEKLYGRHFA